MLGLLAEKVGMTQIFGKGGVVIPVTVLQAGPCTVVMKKTTEKDGYQAVQLGFGEVDAKKRNKPYAGHFLKKGQKVFHFLREMRTFHADSFEPGDTLTVGHFEAGDSVDVAGISKGKGFQGVMKRHHFAGGNDSHGCSISHRSAGSIGQRTYPGKVFKGKRMAGRMGGKKVTVKNLKIVGVEAKEHLLLVEGAIPGANHGIVAVYSRSGDFEKRFLATRKKETDKKDIST